MNANPELQLLERIQTGDEDALVALHTRYANLVYSVAYRVLNEPMVAEEVTQDTFMRLWHKSDAYDASKGRFLPWLLTITRRLAIDALRQRQRREPQAGMLFMDEDPNIWENILSESGDSELRSTLREALARLPDEQRTLLELTYFYGMTHSDLAEHLALPLGTVKTRIRLGMQKLREAWLESAPVNPAEDD
ncbi:MAG: sigma-70 family RNA polymerase sigma factor [Anaerolineae bacterium]|nr:sigma-70 family RNA polymerase sigma factor [Anaerolineae bacterium]